MAVVQRLLTAEDFERMVRAGEFDECIEQAELVDGEIVWLPPPALRHAQVVLNILKLLIPFAERIGAVLWPDNAGFRVGPNRQNVRIPDVSLVMTERRHIATLDAAVGSEAPDLCIEVLSPEQHGEAYARPKIAEYIAAGAKVVWLVDPDSRTLRVYEAGKREFTTYPEGEDITLDILAPGFRARVADFFPAG